MTLTWPDIRVRVGVLLLAGLTGLLAVAAVPTAAQAPAPAQAPPNIAGKWNMALEIPAMGTVSPKLEFKQDGAKISGTYTGGYGTFELEGVLKDRVLEFAFVMNAQGTAVEVGFRGEVAADGTSITKGTGAIEGLGDVTWTATRAK